jgi:hypothetical protein
MYISPALSKVHDLTSYTATESTLVPDNDQDQISEEHAAAKKLRQERRKLWDRMEQCEERIEEYQKLLSRGVVVNGLTVDQRVDMCEQLEKELGQICDRLYDLGGELDAVAHRAHGLVSKQMESSK